MSWSPEVIAAWQRLGETAEAWTKAKEDRQARNAFHFAALAYAKATGTTPTKPGRSAVGRPSGHEIPGGRSKGTPIEDAERNDLEWWIDRLESSLDDPDKARWRAKNEELLNAMKKELATR